MLALLTLLIAAQAAPPPAGTPCSPGMVEFDSYCRSGSWFQSNFDNPARDMVTVLGDHVIGSHDGATVGEWTGPGETIYSTYSDVAGPAGLYIPFSRFGHDLYADRRTEVEPLGSTGVRVFTELRNKTMGLFSGWSLEPVDWWLMECENTGSCTYSSQADPVGGTANYSWGPEGDMCDRLVSLAYTELYQRCQALPHDTRALTLPGRDSDPGFWNAFANGWFATDDPMCREYALVGVWRFAEQVCNPQELEVEIETPEDFKYEWNEEEEDWCPDYRTMTVFQDTGSACMKVIASYECDRDSSGSCICDLDEIRSQTEVDSSFCN